MTHTTNQRDYPKWRIVAIIAITLPFILWTAAFLIAIWFPDLTTLQNNLGWTGLLVFVPAALNGLAYKIEITL